MACPVCQVPAEHLVTQPDTGQNLGTDLRLRPVCVSSGQPGATGTADLVHSRAGTWAMAIISSSASTTSTMRPVDSVQVDLVQDQPFRHSRVLVRAGRSATARASMLRAVTAASPSTAQSSTAQSSTVLAAMTWVHLMPGGTISPGLARTGESLIFTSMDTPRPAGPGVRVIGQAAMSSEPASVTRLNQSARPMGSSRPGGSHSHGPKAGTVPVRSRGEDQALARRISQA